MPVIEGAEAGQSGGSIHLAYCPEFVALGRVVQGMLNPDLVLIGANDKVISQDLATFYRGIVQNDPKVIEATLASAEMAKLAINAMLAFKVTYANLLGRLCHELPGASVDEVERAVGSDSRIGPKFLRGGLGFGGPCLPRDARALSALCRQLEITSQIPDAVSNFNASIPGELVRLIAREVPRDSAVGLLGLAYRPGTAITDESQACQLTVELCDAGYDVFVHDPLVRVANCAEFAASQLHECEDISALLARCDTIVIATPDKEYESIEPEFLRGHLVFDCWRTLRPEVVQRCLHNSGNGEFRYVPFGVGSESVQRACEIVETEE